MRDSRVLVAAAAGVGLIVGYLVNGWLQPGPPARPAAAPAEAGGTSGAGSIAEEIAALKSALDEERSLRGALEMEVAMLRGEVGRQAAPGAEPGLPSEGAREGGPAAKPASGEDAGEPPAHAAAGMKEWFDEAALVEQGIAEYRAASLRERFEALQMEELYLRDQAVREGWLNRPRYQTQLEELRNESRTELGEEDYDLLLWASGRNNRVRLSDVLQDSPAAAAGIEPGDVVLRYDDKPIFGLKDLISATTAGESGTTVSLDVDRNGRRVRVYLPRGPLGARIHPVRRFPGETP